MKTKLVRNSLVIGTILTSAAFSGQTSASTCKGLEAKACGAEASCTWIQGYERKDGRQVKSFCRAKPQAKSKPSVSAGAKAPASSTK